MAAITTMAESAANVNWFFHSAIAQYGHRGYTTSDRSGE